MAKCGRLVEQKQKQSGFQFVPAVFSHTGQLHTAFKDLIREQIRQKIVAFEGQAKPSLKLTLCLNGGQSVFLWL